MLLRSVLQAETLDSCQHQPKLEATWAHSLGVWIWENWEPRMMNWPEMSKWSKWTGSQAETVEVGARGEGYADAASSQGEDQRERVGRASCKMQGGLLLRTFLYKCICLYRYNPPDHLFGLQSCFPRGCFHRPPLCITSYLVMDKGRPGR